MAVVVAAAIGAVATIIVAVLNKRTKDDVKKVYDEIKSPNGMPSGETLHVVMKLLEQQGSMLQTHVSLPPEHAHARRR